MKKIFLIVALFASLLLDAQSVYYYLPRNVIKLELTIEETNYHIGPYAEFASDMLGTNDYIKENKTEINIKGIDIQLGSQVDPNAAFYFESDEKNKEPLPNMILDQDGIVKAIGYDNIPAEMLIDRNIVEYNSDEYKEATAVSFIEILDIQDDEDDDDDEEGSAKPKKITKEDKAKIALDKIDKARNAYFELVSGFQEVAYGNTLPYMVDNVKVIENEYVSLFKGKVVKTTYKRCFYVIPERNQANGNILVGKLDNGESLKIAFETKNAPSNAYPSSEEIATAAQTNKAYYRIPVQTNAKITLGNETIATKPLIISQFGELKLISTKNNKILFNPNTGQIISFTK